MFIKTNKKNLVFVTVNQDFQKWAMRGQAAADVSCVTHKELSHWSVACIVCCVCDMLVTQEKAQHGSPSKSSPQT